MVPAGVAGPRRAAATVVLRGAGERREVLLVRRAPPALLDGGWAFPGGGERPDDAHALPGESSGPHDDELRRARVAAVRELAEELGLWPGVAGGPPTAAERRRLATGAIGLGALLAARGAHLDLETLRPAGLWRLRGFVAGGLEIRLFVVEVSDPRCGEALSPSPEASRVRWVRPAQLLAEWEAGEAVLTRSVLVPLRRLAELGDEDAAESLAVVDDDESDRTELRRGVELLALASPTLPPATHTNCYLLGTGEERVVVDPPSPWEEPTRRLDRRIDALRDSGVRVRELWLTHHHADHTGAVEHLKRRLGVRCRAHPLTTALLPPNLVDAPLADDEEVSLDGPLPQHWRVVFTPGHTRGHVSFFETSAGSLVVGDHMAGEGTVVVDPPDGNMKAYFESLHRVGELGARLLLPGHGPPTCEVAGRVDAYLRHRQGREDAIVAALRGGAGRISEMVEVVYTDVPRAMHPLAERNVFAHLEKLEEESRVCRSGESWRLLADA